VTTAAPGRRERTKAANRAAILEAALAVFGEMGYDAASVRDVIRRTDLASGTFYNYFPDKEAIFRALVEQTGDEARRRVRNARANARSAREFVEDAYRAYFEFMVEDPATSAFLRRNAGTIPAFFGDRVVPQGTDELAEDLREAMARGELPEVDVDWSSGPECSSAIRPTWRARRASPRSCSWEEWRACRRTPANLPFVLSAGTSACRACSCDRPHQLPTSRGLCAFACSSPRSSLLPR
jgi:AcrR family transcriptional regulator